MIKQVVTAASFAFGGAGVILVGYLSANPRAFTRPVADAPSRVIAVRAPIAEAPANIDTALVLPEMIVSPLPRSSAKVRPAVETNTPVEPCSQWSDVGAMYIVPGGATGTRQVRTLCATATR